MSEEREKRERETAKFTPWLFIEADVIRQLEHQMKTLMPRSASFCRRVGLINQTQRKALLTRGEGFQDAEDQLIGAIFW